MPGGGRGRDDHALTQPAGRPPGSPTSPPPVNRRCGPPMRPAGEWRSRWRRPAPPPPGPRPSGHPTDDVIARPSSPASACANASTYWRTLSSAVPANRPASRPSQMNTYRSPAISARLVTTLSATKPAAYSSEPGMTAIVKAIAIDSPPRPAPTTRPASSVDGTTRAIVIAGGHRGLRQHDPPALDRLDQQVDGRPVVELGSEHAGPEHERDERQHGRDQQRVEQAGGQARAVRRWSRRSG